MKNVRRALALAGRMTIADLFGSYGRLALSAVVGALLCVASYSAMRLFGQGDAWGELLPVAVGPIVLISVASVGFFVNWLCRIPYLQWSDAASRVTELERRLRPVVSVRTATNHRADPVDYETTRTTLGGTRQTVLRNGPNHTLRLDITNESATTIVGCEAYLVRFEAIDAETQPSAWFSLRLPWLRAGTVDEEGANIPPSGMRSIALFRVINNRVHLMRDDGVPVHMVHAIKDRGEYSGLVAISSQNAPTAHVAFSLSCLGPDVHPIMAVERGSPFDDDWLFWARESSF